MYTRLFIAAAALAAATAPASAAIVVYNSTSYTVGQTINISYTGVSTPSAHATLALKFTGVNGAGDYQFMYSLTNTSVAPSTNSNASGFGFDLSGGTFLLGNSTITADTGSDINNLASGSISGGVKLDFCATSGNNCSGGQNQGPRPGLTQTGNFVLAFSGADPGTITLSNATVRFQNTVPTGSDIGTPNGTPPLPEPATWAMMLVGFGATGAAMRRSRRQTARLSQLA